MKKWENQLNNSNPDIDPEHESNEEIQSEEEDDKLKTYTAQDSSKEQIPQIFTKDFDSPLKKSGEVNTSNQQKHKNNNLTEYNPHLMVVPKKKLTRLSSNNLLLTKICSGIENKQKIDQEIQQKEKVAEEVKSNVAYNAEIAKNNIFNEDAISNIKKATSTTIQQIQNDDIPLPPLDDNLSPDKEDIQFKLNKFTNDESISQATIKKRVSNTEYQSPPLKKLLTYESKDIAKVKQNQWVKKEEENKITINLNSIGKADVIEEVKEESSHKAAASPKKSKMEQLANFSNVIIS